MPVHVLGEDVLLACKRLCKDDPVQENDRYAACIVLTFVKLTSDVAALHRRLCRQASYSF